MSQENVEIVRRLWQINISRGPEACVGYAAEDCVVEDSPELPRLRRVQGPAGHAGDRSALREMWGEFIQEPVEFIDAGDDLVIAVVAVREGLQTWRGEGCCAAPELTPRAAQCEDDCCAAEG